jgi:UDP-N-acetylglucosamine 2-epimerase (non-hydrolysing)
MAVSAMRTLIHLVAGARPNFMKIAPIVRALQARADRFAWRIVHTGQHHDHDMSAVFFEELGIPAPDVHMGAGGGSHARQTARIMIAYEDVLLRERPHCTLVVGDVDSTLACALTARKLQIPVAHVEAGLRSGDTAMPEEINRLATDAISDWLFVTEPSGCDNLRREGRPEERIFFVGHVMIDNLMHQLERLAQTDASGFRSPALRAGLDRYGVVTLHRPSNVDDPEVLAGIVGALGQIATELPLVFPVHPRTRASLQRAGIALPAGVIDTTPLSFMDFLSLWKDAALVLTDSGGLQEETTALGVPCVTLRENTERPITVAQGSNLLAGTRPPAILAAARRALSGELPTDRRPPLWDGQAARRIVDHLARLLPA